MALQESSLTAGTGKSELDPLPIQKSDTLGNILSQKRKKKQGLKISQPENKMNTKS